jgi:hypothetical protein
MEIGRVLRASTQGFTCGTRSSEVNYPQFGAFVLTRAIESALDTFLVGVITAIRIDDDPLVRQLIMASGENPMVVRDQRENRMVPVEIDVLNVGFVQNSIPFHTLPPRPPMSLDEVQLCDDDQIAFFTGLEHNPTLPFIRLILTAGGVTTATELVAASVRLAMQAQPDAQRYDFAVMAGRQIANLLASDPLTLHHVLTLIQPT